MSRTFQCQWQLVRACDAGSAVKGCRTMRSRKNQGAARLGDDGGGAINVVLGCSGNISGALGD